MSLKNRITTQTLNLKTKLQDKKYRMYQPKALELTPTSTGSLSGDVNQCANTLVTRIISELAMSMVSYFVSKKKINDNTVPKQCRINKICCGGNDDIENNEEQLEDISNIEMFFDNDGNLRKRILDKTLIKKTNYLRRKCWIRDLTRENVESNPGPSHKGKITKCNTGQKDQIIYTNEYIKQCEQQLLAEFKVIRAHCGGR